MAHEVSHYVQLLHCREFNKLPIGVECDGTSFVENYRLVHTDTDNFALTLMNLLEWDVNIDIAVVVSLLDSSNRLRNKSLIKHFSTQTSD